MERMDRRRAGFSLTELMIAVGILLVVVTAVMQSFVVQNRAYTVTDQVIEAQQSLRAVAWLLERDARMTGFLVPEAAAACAIDEPNAPDTVWFTDSDALDPTDQARPALGAEVLGGYSTGTGFKSLGVDSVVLDETTPGSGGFYDLDDDGDGDADFAEGAGVILVDVDDPARGVACGTVREVGTNSIGVDFLTAITVPPAGDRVILVPAHVYEVELAPADSDEPQLLRNGRVIATGVEDLQVAFFFDLDRDGIVDGEEVANGEMPGADGADEYASNLYDNRDLREIRINLVTRTRAPDRENDVGQFQTRENRVAPGGNDGYRRRVHTSTVKLRNVGFRGTAT
jgi:prepilin-type N-terminal cleavage/methylation domain-containing protein